MIDVLLDAIIDSVKLVPFLFITYLIMEYIEHKTKDKTKKAIKKSGKFGPLIATNLYAARVITIRNFNCSLSFNF